MMQNTQSENIKVKMKNFPKTLGNFFEKYLKEHTDFDGYVGIQNFKNQRDKKRENNSKQISSTIEDFKELCSCDQSRQVFQNFLLQVLMLCLIQSPKVVDPMQYVKTIATYLATSNDPEKMVLNIIKFMDHQQG